LSVLIDTDSDSDTDGDFDTLRVHNVHDVHNVYKKVESWAFDFLTPNSQLSTLDAN